MDGAGVSGSRRQPAGQALAPFLLFPATLQSQEGHSYLSWNLMGLLPKERSCDLEVRLLPPQKETSRSGGWQLPWGSDSAGSGSDKKVGVGVFSPQGSFAVCCCRVGPRGRAKVPALVSMPSGFHALASTDGRDQVGVGKASANRLSRWVRLSDDVRRKEVFNDTAKLVFLLSSHLGCCRQP